MAQQRQFGPPVYENWKAALRGAPSILISEYPLFTDTRIIGNDLELGPYRLVNPVNARRNQFLRQPSIVVRVSQHYEYELPSMERTDTSLYHGGGPLDELAALVSLLLGIRVKAGSMTRLFEPDSDPMGRPIGWLEQPELRTLPADVHPILPTIPDQVLLDDLAQLGSLPAMDPPEAVALVRSARLYQDALWLAEWEPNLAWLMMVSAVETAANQWSRRRGPAVDRLIASQPELAQLLETRGGKKLVAEVADHIADSLGSTNKFVNFTLEYLPPPPTERPAWPRVEWEDEAMRRGLRQVYSYRSKALHGGTPFPAPMFEPPRRIVEGDAVAERPIGVANATKGGVWVIDDMPMLLHIFEHIARNVLLAWWRQAVPVQPTMST